jgi:glycosyltransferase involved in cell wall biosynthesis
MKINSEDTISIIIPVYNDPEGLQDTVNSLLNQNYKDNYEILIVDNGSRDETLSLAKDYENKYSFVKALKEDKIKGSYAARNKGIKNARGVLLCFIDADMVVPTNWLTKVVNFYNSYKYGYFGCNVKITLNKPTIAAKYNSLNGFPVQHYIQNRHFAPTCCLVTNKSIFHEVGYFNTQLVEGGDVDFGLKVHEAGIKQGFAENIIMYHPARYKFSQLLKKSLRFGRSRAKKNYYSPEKYEFIYKKYFQLKYYSPKNPINIYKKAKNKGIEVNYFEAFLISIYHIPLRIISFYSLIKENKKLRKK